MTPTCTNCGSGDFVWANELKTGSTMTGGNNLLSLRSKGEVPLGTRICRGCGHADLFLRDVTLLHKPQLWRPGEFVPIPSKAASKDPEPAAHAHHAAHPAATPPPHSAPPPAAPPSQIPAPSPPAPFVPAPAPPPPTAPMASPDSPPSPPPILADPPPPAPDDAPTPPTDLGSGVVSATTPATESSDLSDVSAPRAKPARKRAAKPKTA